MHTPQEFAGEYVEVVFAGGDVIVSRFARSQRFVERQVGQVPSAADDVVKGDDSFGVLIGFLLGA